MENPRRTSCLLTLWLCLLCLPEARCTASSQRPSVTSLRLVTINSKPPLTLLAGIKPFLTAPSLASLGWGRALGGPSLNLLWKFTNLQHREATYYILGFQCPFLYSPAQTWVQDPITFKVQLPPPLRLSSQPFSREATLMLLAQQIASSDCRHKEVIICLMVWYLCILSTVSYSL